MAKPYTLRKVRPGLRVMTLSEDMMERASRASIDALRLTIDLTFKDIHELTGDQVALDIDQSDKLMSRMGEPGLDLNADAYFAWRWICQGARARDCQDMAHLLRISEGIVKSLEGWGQVDEPDRSPAAIEAGGTGLKTQEGSKKKTGGPSKR